MNQKNLARGTKTRTFNKNKRRKRILDCAGRIIATEGYDALTLSQLAENANVTIPTIHNLIGKKSEIFNHIIEEMVGRIAVILNRQVVDDPIAAVEAFIGELMSLFSDDEALYKAAFLAGERANKFEQQSDNGIYSKSLGLSIQICANGKSKGFLTGNIETHMLARQVFDCQRLARLDWMHGYIDLAGYRKNVLIGMFIIFCADASPEFKTKLIQKINELHN